MMKETKDQELRFVVRHYEAGRFSPEEALKKIGHEPRRRSLPRWVAAAASLLCLTVLATVLWLKPFTASTPGADSTKPTADTTATTAATASFHFNDAPLPQVLRELGAHYGVTLAATDTTRHLTGTFSGQSLEDILSMIEEVLDVEISQQGQ